jgi:hypothetical protein
LDERQRSSSHHGNSETSDVEVEVQPAFAIGEQSIRDGQVQSLPDQPSRESSQAVIFCGDGQQVREGFALALRAMESHGQFSPIDLPFPVGRPNREDS